METVLGMTDLQIKLFTAIGQIAIAAAVGTIAYRQWRTAQTQADTARKKLRADLFDRKYAKYEELVGLATTAMQGRAPDHVLVDIQRVRKEMAWIFGDVISSWVREHIEKTARNIGVQETLYADGDAPLPERRAILIKKYNYQLALSNNLDALSAKISAQMTLGD